MAYADLNTIHNPSTGVAPPASWGDQVRDNFEYFNSMLANGTGAWTTFTPNVNQSAFVSKTVVYSRAFKAGRFVAGSCAFTISSTGTVSQPITVGVPFTAATAGNIPVGNGYHYNGSINIPFTVVLSTTGTFAMINYQPSGGYYGTTNIPIPVNAAATTQVNPQLASGNSLVFNFFYESLT